MQWEITYIAAIGTTNDDFLSAQYDDLVSLLQNNNMKVDYSFVLLDASPFTDARILKLVMDNYINARGNIEQ
jgi:hypothetical protein